VHSTIGRFCTSSSTPFANTQNSVTIQQLYLIINHRQALRSTTTGILKLRSKPVVCLPPWSSRRRDNHRRHELGKRSNSRIKGLISFRRWLCRSILQTCILLKGEQQLAPVPPSVSGSHLPGGSFPPSRTGAGTLPQPCTPSPALQFQVCEAAPAGRQPQQRHAEQKTLSLQLPRQAPASPSPQERVLVPSPMPDATGQVSPLISLIS